MKNLYILCLALCAMVFFTACDENSPEIPCLSCGNNNGGPVAPDAKKVIIEEFTGVRCVACPGGSKAIEDLLDIHGDRLVAISMHAGDFSPPMPSSTYDFRTADGDQLLDFLGSPDGYPSAVINRNKFGESILQKGQNKWNNFITQSLEGPAKVNIDLDKSYDSGTRVLSITVKIKANETLDGNYNYSVLITENGIVDAQLDADQGLISDYTHKHVLRDVLTKADGDPITESLTEGAVIEKSLSYTLPNDWVAGKCTAIVLVSDAGTTKEVLQVEQTKIAN
ncbi:MAG: Omp28 family outer membrane lipoprotein [Saprospiraceae bacterium]